MAKPYQDEYFELMKKEYHSHSKLIITAYFFLALSVLFYVIFFKVVQALPVIGTAFAFDLAAVVYVVKALYAQHPFWEMQEALQVKKNPNHNSVSRWIAAIEVSKSNGWKPFQGRALEIFTEVLMICEKTPEVPEKDLAALRDVLNGIL